MIAPMILADTNIWIDHIRYGDRHMIRLLELEQADAHPLVIAELALGSLAPGSETLNNIGSLPMLAIAEHKEVMALVEIQGLSGSGIGYVDCHLLCAAMIAGPRLWTRDKRLAAQAERLAIRHDPPMH